MSAPLQDPSVSEGALPDTSGSIEGRETAGMSQGQIVLRKFLRHQGAMISLVLLIIVIVFSFTAVGMGPIPGWWKYNFYNSSDVMNGGAPTWHLSNPFSLGEHPFGQDDIGRDNFARVLKGVQVSILMMLIMGATLLVVGVVVGALAGYYRGWVDNALMRVTDGFIMLPTIVVGAILGVLAGHLANPPLLAFVLGLILWPTLARLVRGDFLSLREREFVDSARVAGASDFRIMFKHMLPNAMGVVIVNTTLMMSQAIVLETALSFLGFGVHAPDVSLGQLINEYQGSFATRPWLFWWPGLFIIIVALAVNFIGDGLRDAFDPRQRKIPSARKMARADRLLASSANLAGPFTPGGTGDGSTRGERRRSIDDERKDGQ
ncbi:ABC transporter permease subunit [Brevibacterium sp. 5221]|uniref:Oligopeptide transport system permease protein OppC n=1 Tax=Brevibacterium rongguiense TaxID=2695267 RepID=A0A6N9H757_9MICO|nr:MULTISPECIES: ABC transporter permease [Brevibacterium]MYM19745.1 ABC transporter permease subunit [Brevibacterium rongguiense]WAL40468.1 ABC transporter permease [Brevibacterium sp. BRM-1]